MPLILTTDAFMLSARRIRCIGLQRIKIPADGDLLAWSKKQERGYETRINRALRE